MSKINIIQHPSIILIIGRRRYGKSALGYYILEKFHNEQPELKIFVVSLPKEKHSLLPDWITPVETVEELPDNCVAIIDEGALRYHAYMWGQKETIVMDRMISISGQKGQTFVFITHTMRKFAITLLLDIDILLCKKPSLLHSKLERSEVRKLVDEVSREFNKLPKEEVKKNTFVISDDFKGFIRNKLPSFWTEDLSKSYAGISINGDKQEEETEEKEVKPIRIERGLKLWFKLKDKMEILEILSKNSTIDGVLSSDGVFCTAGRCHYDFDLKMNKNGKYRVSNNKFDLEESIKEFKEKEIPVIIDIESAYPLNMDDLLFDIEKPSKKKEEDELEEYAKKLKL